MAHPFQSRRASRAPCPSDHPPSLTELAPGDVLQTQSGKQYVVRGEGADLFINKQTGPAYLDDLVDDFGRLHGFTAVGTSAG